MDGPPTLAISTPVSQVPHINARLRSLGGTAQLGVDLVKAAPEIQPAVEFALGNALVCESVDEARRLGHGQERHKVASRDGTLIARNGAMTGGGAGKNWNQKASAWDRAEKDRVQAALEEAKSALEALPSEQDAAVAHGSARRMLQDAESCMAARQVDVDTMQTLLRSKRGEAGNTERAIKERWPELAARKKELKASELKVAKLQKSIDEAKDRVFKPFSTRLGMPSVREHEESIQAAADAAAEAVCTADLKVQELAVEVEAGARSLTERAVKMEQLQKRLKTCQALHDAAEDERRKIEEEGSIFHAQLADVDAEAESVAARLREMEELDSEAKSAEAELRKRADPLRRSAARAERARNAALAAAHDIWQDAMLAGVALRGSGQGKGDGGSSGDDADLLEGSEALPADLVTDFGTLPRSLRDLRGDANARDTKATELLDGIESLATRLEDMQPNLKAPEEWQEVLDEEAALKEETDVAKAEHKRAQNAFAAIAEERAARFNTAFDHVAAAIDGVYKDLTRLTPGDPGGSANLSRTQSEEPFAGGINFSAIPPRKRFRDMAQLSGGEKTLASLALLLAIHSYKPSPFFVFDEVDAALDATNLSRVANYVRKCTRGDAVNVLQGIVISLKDAFYEKADALIGVTKNTYGNASAVYTFDLTPFGEPED